MERVPESELHSLVWKVRVRRKRFLPRKIHLHLLNLMPREPVER